MKKKKRDEELPLLMQYSSENEIKEEKGYFPSNPRNENVRKHKVICSPSTSV